MSAGPADFSRERRTPMTVRRFSEGDRGPEDDDDLGMSREEMLAELGRRGFDTTPFQDPAKCADECLMEMLRGTEDLTPKPQGYTVTPDDAQLYDAMLPDGQTARLMEGGSLPLPRKYAEAVRSRSRMYYTETGPGSPVVHTPQNYAGFYECFAESFRKLGVDKAKFVNDAMRFGRHARIGEGVMPPPKPAPPPPSKFSEHSDGRRVELFFDCHQADIQKLCPGYTRAEFVRTWRGSGMSADEFLRGTK
jgi:hypothetical protein